MGSYRRLRQSLRRFLPDQILAPAARIKGAVKVGVARVVFALARTPSVPLPIEKLEALLDHYVEPQKIRYDEEGLLLRAEDSIARMGQLIDLSQVRSALELGCWDGMVSARLATDGARCCGVDLRSEGFDQRARALGVRFTQADAGRLPYRPSTFDLVFSFAAFEHFAAPAQVVEEVARVLRPGGYFHLEFGPIAAAPYGLHAYRSIPVPYIQILFRPDDLAAFAERHGLPHDWPYVNGVSLPEYRRIFAAARRDFDTIFYEEGSGGGVGAELIIRYPRVFRRVSDRIEDFLVSGFVVCLRPK